MPLAPAHPAAVLPLERLGLPLSALVAGAVAPDGPVYLPIPVAYSTTHSAPGLVVDAVIGLGLLALWDLLVRDAVVDLLGFLRRRTERRVRLDRRAWSLAPIAVAVGAATHVLWDSFTHDYGFPVQQLAVLRQSLGGLPVYGWLQHLSTVLGTLLVAAYCLHRLRSLPCRPRPPGVRRPALWVAPVPAAALVVGTLTGELEATVGAALLAVVSVATAYAVGSRAT